MNKFKGYLQLFFIFLAILIFYAHMIIPHDHHLSDSGSPSDETCPVSDNNSRHHTRFPYHCHAFNDLQSEKAIGGIIITSRVLPDIEPALLSNSSNINFRLFFTGPFYLVAQSVNSGILELSSLRAPPSFA